jgi:hypothetical protein
VESNPNKHQLQEAGVSKSAAALHSESEELVMHRSQGAKSTETELAGLGEFEVAGYPQGIDIFEVHFATVGLKCTKSIISRQRAFIEEEYCRAINLVPTRLEQGRGKDDAGDTVIVHADQFIGDVLDESDVEGAIGLVADSKEFPFDKRFAVNLAKRSIGISLGAFGVVRQDVGDNTLIPSFGRVIYGSVRGSAKTFEDGAGSSPGRNVFGPSAGFQQPTAESGLVVLESLPCLQLQKRDCLVNLAEEPFQFL